MTVGPVYLSAVNDSYTVDEDTPLIIAAPGVLANDPDVTSTSAALFIDQASSTANLTLANNGGFTYQPPPDFFGTDTFRYQLIDWSQSSNYITVTITVTSVNDAPVANADAFELDEDPLWFEANVLANDSDVDGDTLTVSLITGVSHGGVILNSNGTFNYTPNTNYHGTDSFTYQAYDGTDYSQPATVTLTVNPVNDAPSFTASAPPAVNEDAGTQSLSAWATFNPGPSNEATQLATYVVSNVSNLGLFAVAPSVAADGTLSYTPALNAFGTSTIDVTVQDSGGTANGGVDASSAQTFIITVKELPTVELYAINRDALEMYSNDGVIQAVRSGPLDSAITVAFYIVGSTTPYATTQDFHPITFSVSFEVGAAAATNYITIDPIDDSLPEPLERFDIILLPSSQYKIGANGSEYVTIEDNDGFIEIAAGIGIRPVTGQSQPVSRDSTAIYEVYLTSDATDDDEVTAWTVQGTAHDDEDFESTVSTFSFAAGMASGTVIGLLAVPILNGTPNSHGQEAFTLKVGNGTYGNELFIEQIASANIAPAFAQTRQVIGASFAAIFGGGGIGTFTATDADGDTIRYSLAGAGPALQIDRISGAVAPANPFEVSDQLRNGGQLSFSVLASDGLETTTLQVVVVQHYAYFISQSRSDVSVWNTKTSSLITDNAAAGRVAVSNAVTFVSSSFNSFQNANNIGTNATWAGSSVWAAYGGTAVAGPAAWVGAGAVTVQILGNAVASNLAASNATKITEYDRLSEAVVSADRARVLAILKEVNERIDTAESLALHNHNSGGDGIIVASSAAFSLRQQLKSELPIGNVAMTSNRIYGDLLLTFAANLNLNVEGSAWYATHMDGYWQSYDLGNPFGWDGHDIADELNRIGY